MITLKKAYDFVMKEINNINNTVTVEDLEKTFKDYNFKLIEKMQKEFKHIINQFKEDESSLNKIIVSVFINSNSINWY